MPCMPAAEAAAAHRLIERLLSRHRPLPGRSCVALLGWLCETPFRSERKLTPPQFAKGQEQTLTSKFWRFEPRL